jgi:hypothetical protein
MRMQLGWAGPAAQCEQGSSAVTPQLTSSGLGRSESNKLKDAVTKYTIIQLREGEALAKLRPYVLCKIIDTEALCILK